MAMWRCPHCSTPQAETSRCWVCKRSSTSCGTCRNYRRSVASGIGYCGLDRRRAPLLGSEIRPCWEEAPAVGTAPPASPAPGPRPGEQVPTGPRRQFVPVDAAAGRDRTDGPGPDPATALVAATEPFVDEAAAPQAFGLWDEPDPGTDRPALGA